MTFESSATVAYSENLVLLNTLKENWRYFIYHSYTLIALLPISNLEFSYGREEIDLDVHIIYSSFDHCFSDGIAACFILRE